MLPPSNRIIFWEGRYNIIKTSHIKRLHQTCASQDNNTILFEHHSYFKRLHRVTAATAQCLEHGLEYKRLVYSVYSESGPFNYFLICRNQTSVVYCSQLHPHPLAYLVAIVWPLCCSNEYELLYGHQAVWFYSLLQILSNRGCPRQYREEITPKYVFLLRRSLLNINLKCCQCNNLDGRIIPLATHTFITFHQSAALQKCFCRGAGSDMPGPHNVVQDELSTAPFR